MFGIACFGLFDCCMIGSFVVCGVDFDYNWLLMGSGFIWVVVVV